MSESVGWKALLAVGLAAEPRGRHELRIGGQGKLVRPRFSGPGEQRLPAHGLAHRSLHGRLQSGYSLDRLTGTIISGRRRAKGPPVAYTQRVEGESHGGPPGEEWAWRN